MILLSYLLLVFFFFQAEDGIRDRNVTGVQTCALPIFDTVLQHAPHEDNTNLMATNFANARYAVAHFLSDDRREAKRAEVADKFWALLQAAEPGSDAQLTIARSTIAALASTPDAS